jgi:hypothetical protein
MGVAGVDSLELSSQAALDRMATEIVLLNAGDLSLRE